MKSRPDITDSDRSKFLEKLSHAARASDVMLNSFATEFVGSFKKVQRHEQWMTDGRRSKCDELRGEYGATIGMPLPPDPNAVVNRPKTPEADAGCCQFLIRDDDRRLVPCNAPAVLQRRNGFRYCQSCADNVLDSLKRRNLTMHLFKYP
jgi:hypothetical protein